MALLEITKFVVWAAVVVVTIAMIGVIALPILVFVLVLAAAVKVF